MDNLNDNVSEDNMSCTTVSSSGIPDSIVTILCPEDDKDLKEKMQQKLEAMSVSVAEPLCAGRTKAKNLVSRVRHAEITIILLPAEALKFLNSLDTVANPKILKVSSLLILYKDKKAASHIDKSWPNATRVCLRDTVENNVSTVLSFIKAQNKTDTSEDLKTRFLNNLILDVFVTSLTDEMSWKLDDIGRKLYELFGDFAKLSSHELIHILMFNDSLLVVDDLVKKRVDFLPNIITNESYDSTAHKFDDNSDFQRLRSQLNDFDYTSSFFLISSRLNVSEPMAKSISRVPWAKVFDFDVNSRTDGLLSVIESSMKLQRTFLISSEAETKDLSNKSTDWYFPLGMTNQDDKADAESWFDANRAVLSKHFDNIVDFCNCATFPVFIILWYDCDDFMSECLSWCLSLLFTKVPKSQGRRVLFFCENTPNTSSPLYHDILKYKLRDTTFAVPFELVCSWLNLAKTPAVASCDGCTLPAVSTNDCIQSTVKVSRKDVAWLELCIEVVSVEASGDLCKNSNESGLAFLKGGKVTWDDLSSGMIAIDRAACSKIPIHDILETEILEDRKSFLLNICHEPGGGGTTIARQLLYSIHRRVPCGVVSPDSLLSAFELVERLEFLQRATGLPVVLLVDGLQREHLVNQVMEMCNCAVVIFYVQQFNSELLKNAYDCKDKRCTVTGNVTQLEACDLADIFSKFVPEKRNDLLRLTDSVVHEQNQHYLVEYGLTALGSNFTTIHNYVQSYLQLPKKKHRIFDLDPWQKVLAYLSLVTFYGQDLLPRQIFQNTLKEENDTSAVVKKDLKVVASEVLVHEEGYYWKIGYHVVAAEILEQVLCEEPNIESSGRRIGELSAGARTNLYQLVIAFIEMVKNAINGSLPPKILQLLFSVFLKRDNRGDDKTFSHGKKRPFSRLLEHLPKNEDQIMVLEKLTDAFPDIFKFHAHLGRLYGILNRFDEAKLCFQKAIDIFVTSNNAQCTRKNELGLIYNMYGYACLTKANHEVRKLNKQPNPKIIKVLGLVNIAIQLFKKAQEQLTCNFSYSYIGEIKARLCIATYMHAAFQGCNFAFEDDGSREYAPLKVFIQDSYPQCAYLFEECRYLSSQDVRRSKKDLDICKGKFALCYGSVSNSLLGWTNNIHLRRSQIAHLKMQLKEGRHSYISSVEDIGEEETVRNIVDLLEETINEVLSRNDCSVSITVEILQWFDAIRKPQVNDDYLLENILSKMKSWNSRNEGVHSTYYLYIVTYLLALFCNDENFCCKCNNQAKELREILKKKRFSVTRPLNQEVVVKHARPTVKKILCVSRDTPIGSKGKSFWEQHKLLNQFQVFTGTIICYDNARGGLISIDRGPSSRCRVEAFFVPLECGLVQQRWKNERCRVEFFIRFSFDRGAEAVAVRRLARA